MIILKNIQFMLDFHKGPRNFARELYRSQLLPIQITTMPASIYLVEVKMEAPEQGVKYVQS